METDSSRKRTREEANLSNSEEEEFVAGACPSPAGPSLLGNAKSLHTYNKMGMKMFTSISEWDVEICQGISGMLNISLTDKYIDKSAGRYESV